MMNSKLPKIFFLLSSVKYRLKIIVVLGFSDFNRKGMARVRTQVCRSLRARNGKRRSKRTMSRVSAVVRLRSSVGRTVSLCFRIFTHVFGEFLQFKNARLVFWNVFCCFVISFFKLPTSIVIWRIFLQIIVNRILLVYKSTKILFCYVRTLI